MGKGQQRVTYQPCFSVWLTCKGGIIKDTRWKELERIQSYEQTSPTSCRDTAHEISYLAYLAMRNIRNGIFCITYTARQSQTVRER